MAGGLPRRLGRWELVELAAEGTWSHVYRACPSGSPSDRAPAYAVKVLRPECEKDPRAIAIFAREAMVGSSISHPHVVPVLESGGNRGPRFLVMPWLEGATLEARLAAGELLDLPAALWIVRQAAEALDALYAGGYLHGDVKPGNLFVSPGGHVTLLDLGFARRRDEAGPAAGRSVMGTCNYLAPECATPSQTADIRSDIYSLGAVLFEMLAGRLPFEGSTPADLVLQHRQSAPPNLLRLAPQLPPAAAWLVRRMMAKDPLRRPQTPRELIRQLIELEIATFSERALA